MEGMLVYIIIPRKGNQSEKAAHDTYSIECLNIHHSRKGTMVISGMEDD